MPRLTHEQLATRKRGMGATDVVEALGLSPYEGAGPMRLFMQKTSSDPEDESTSDKPWLEWGHIQEPIILSWYERESGNPCIPGGHVPSPVHPWLWATLDAKVVGDARIVEIKNVASNMAYHWDPYAEDGVPRYVRAQVMVGMHCSGARLADVVASVGGRAPHTWTVAWDEELWGLLESGAAKFWARVLEQDAPPLDGTPATKEYLRRKYPSNVDRVVRDATEAENGIGSARARELAVYQQAEKMVAILDAQLLAACGTADGIQGDGWKMTWRVNKAGKRTQRFTVQGEE